MGVVALDCQAFDIKFSSNCVKRIQKEHLKIAKSPDQRMQSSVLENESQHEVDSMYLQPLAQGMARAMCQAVALKDFGLYH